MFCLLYITIAYKQWKPDNEIIILSLNKFIKEM